MGEKYRKTKEGHNNKFIFTGLFIVLLIGIIIIFDGIVSIIFQFDESFLFQFGRIVRIFLGLFVVGIIWFMYISKKSIKKTKGKRR